MPKHTPLKIAWGAKWALYGGDAYGLLLNRFFALVIPSMLLMEGIR
jgi:hypothetical protein